MGLHRATPGRAAPPAAPRGSRVPPRAQPARRAAQTWRDLPPSDEVRVQFAVKCCELLFKLLEIFRLIR